MGTTMSNCVHLRCDAEAAAQAMTAALGRRGLRVQRSFDLRAARAGHADCACPHHGTAQCTCQYVVLLVYSARGGPGVITFHGMDTECTGEVVEDVNSPANTQLASVLMAELLGVAQAFTAPRAEIPDGTECAGPEGAALGA